MIEFMRRFTNRKSNRFLQDWFDHKQMIEGQAKDVILRAIYNSPKNNYALDLTTLTQLVNEPKVSIKPLILDLMRLDYIEQRGSSYFLTTNGRIVIAAGGFMRFTYKQSENESLDHAVKRAAISSNRWSIGSVLLNGTFAVITVGISFYALSQSSKSEENTIKSDQTVQRAELLLIRAQQERDSMGLVLKHIMHISDSLRASIHHPLDHPVDSDIHPYNKTPQDHRK